jgi:ABC-2 type transport system permease protein
MLFAPRSGPASKLDVGLVDLDQSARSRLLGAAITGEEALAVVPMGETEARTSIAGGKVTAAVLIPKGLGDQVGLTSFFAQDKPELVLLLDPSHTIEGQLLAGLLQKAVMQSIAGMMMDRENSLEQFARLRDSADLMGQNDPQRSLWRQFFTIGIQAVQAAPADPAPTASEGNQAGGGFQMPVQVRTEAVVGEYGHFNSYANSFAGMLVMFLFFVGINGGASVIDERKRGTWRRLRLAPLPRTSLLIAKACCTAIQALIIIVGVYGFGFLVFGIQVRGSWPGFIVMLLLAALLTASFALLLAGLGQTEAQVQGYGSLAAILLSFLGGAWFPVWMMPDWLRGLSLALPTRWMMDGFQAATWRGLGLEALWLPMVMTVAFILLFGLIGLKAFRWND